MTRGIRDDWRPGPGDVARVLARLEERGFDTTGIAPGLIAMAGGEREPGDDDNESAADDEDGLVPLGEVLGQIGDDEQKRREVVLGSAAKLESLVAASGGRRR